MSCSLKVYQWYDIDGEPWRLVAFVTVCRPEGSYYDCDFSQNGNDMKRLFFATSQPPVEWDFNARS